MTEGLKKEMKKLFKEIQENTNKQIEAFKEDTSKLLKKYN